VMLQGNTLIGTDAMVAVTPQSASALRDWTWDDNEYIGTGPEVRRDVLFALDDRPLTAAEWRKATGFDGSSRFTTGRPAGTKVFVRPNRYEAGRANVVIYNWDRQPAVRIDLNAVLTRGARFEIRSAFDYLGDPVVTGVFDGAMVAVPMSGLRVAEPIGGTSTRSRTLGEFGAFVVRTVGGEGAATTVERRAVQAAPAPARTAPTTAAPAESLARLVGRYVSRSPTGDVQIALQGDRLTAQIHNEPGRPVFPLTPVSATRFRLDGAPPGVFAIFQIDGGVVRSLTLERGSAPSVTLMPR